MQLLHHRLPKRALKASKTKQGFGWISHRCTRAQSDLAGDSVHLGQGLSDHLPAAFAAVVRGSGLLLRDSNQTVTRQGNAYI